jgi:hypothetical protein
MLLCRTSDTDEPSKAAEQKPVNVLATSSRAAALAPPPLVGAGLMACSYNNARSSAQRVLRYLESLKDAEADREGNRPPSLLHATCSSANFILLTCIALTAKLEAAEKALAEERAAQQVTDQALQASKETCAALTRDLQYVCASVDAIKLCAKSATLDEVAMRGREAQARLQTLCDKKKAIEQLLESAQKTLSKQDFSSSAVISSAVAHTVALLKSLTPDLYTEKLRRDFPFDNDEEQDALVDSVYDTAQYFVS